MTARTRLAPTRAPDTRRRGRRWRRAATVAGGLVVVLAIAAWLSPIGDRFRADAASQPPVTGVTEVDIVDSTFSPAALAVPAGTTVTWRWTDDVAHDVSFARGESAPVRTSGTWWRTFDRPGVYAFSCSLHLFMDGRVVVAD